MTHSYSDHKEAEVARAYNRGSNKTPLKMSDGEVILKGRRSELNKSGNSPVFNSKESLVN